MASARRPLTDRLHTVRMGCGGRSDKQAAGCCGESVGDPQARGWGGTGLTMEPGFFGRLPLRLRSFLRSPVASALFLARRWRLCRKGLRFGRGLYLEGRVEVTCAKNIELGENVHLGRDVCLGAWPGGRIVVGNNTYIGRWTIVLGHRSVVIGNDCLIAPGCHITDVNHGIEVGELIRKQPLRSQEVRIGNDVWLGAGCSVLPGVRIEDGAVIGARAVVTQDVPASAVAVGVPAKVIRHR